MKSITVVAAFIPNSKGEIFSTHRGYGEFKNWWELPGVKVEYDYPSFHLTMHCYWCSILSGNLELKEHEAAKWLAPDELESVNWLPADLILLPFLR